MGPFELAGNAKQILPWCIRSGSLDLRYQANAGVCDGAANGVEMTFDTGEVRVDEHGTLSGRGHDAADVLQHVVAEPVPVALEFSQQIAR